MHLSSVSSLPYIAVPGTIAFLSLQTFITLAKDEDKVSKFIAQPESVKNTRNSKHAAEHSTFQGHARISRHLRIWEQLACCEDAGGYAWLHNTTSF